MLDEGMAAMNLTATEKQKERLLAFIRLLRKWNRVYNLTSIRNPVDMVHWHLLDSLSILPYLKGNRVLDVGTGAGLPGLPLALFSPDKEFTLLDSDAKKIRFVRQATIEMCLTNINAEHIRIERFRPQEGFDSILVRAFASLNEIAVETVRLLNPGGVILAQKGNIPQDEINLLENSLVEVFPIEIQGLGAERHLVAIKVRN